MGFIHICCWLVHFHIGIVHILLCRLHHIGVFFSGMAFGFFMRFSGMHFGWNTGTAFMIGACAACSGCSFRACKCRCAKHGEDCCSQDCAEFFHCCYSLETGISACFQIRQIWFMIQLQCGCWNAISCSEIVVFFWDFKQDLSLYWSKNNNQKINQNSAEHR